jgi:carbonic anhydrase
MCEECEGAAVHRRDVMKWAVGAAALAVGSFAAPAFANSEAEFAMTPDEALARLREGNAAFVADAGACAANLASLREELALGQHPYASIVTCADSRVSSELIFGGATLGDLFTSRNAGNVVDTAVLGTLEYGAAHLKSPLIVVMGHTKCGAIGAACEVVANGTDLGGAVAKMVQPILPVALSIGAADPDLVSKTVLANARKGVQTIMQDSATIATLVAEGKVRVLAAVYDITTGVVTFDDAA